MKCIICGCEHMTACMTEKYGNCAWHGYRPLVCTHCVSPKAFAAAERHTENIKQLKPINAETLVDVLATVKLEVFVIGSAVNVNAVKVFLRKGKESKLIKLINMWYPKSREEWDRRDKNIWKLKYISLQLDEQVFQLRKKELLEQQWSSFASS